jgi:hypothetical protein
MDVTGDLADILTIAVEAKLPPLGAELPKLDRCEGGT